MAEEKKSYPIGEICWLEVPVSDATRAVKFYTEIFGWECDGESAESATPGTTSLRHFRRGGLSGALLVMEKGNHMINNDVDNPAKVPVLTTLCVHDVDKTLEKVKTLGGKTLLPRTAIGGDMGFFARFIDCEGNLLGCWSQN